jgi:leucyl-tRNA synthetase
LVEYKETRSKEALHDLVDHVAGMLGMILLVISIIGVIAAPIVMFIFTPGFADKPDARPELMEETTVTIAIQVKGKLRDTIEVEKDMDQDALEKLALATDKIQHAIAGQTVRKVIIVPNRIVNIVV